MLPARPFHGDEGGQTQANGTDEGRERRPPLTTRRSDLHTREECGQCVRAPFQPPNQLRWHP